MKKKRKYRIGLVIELMLLFLTLFFAVEWKNVVDYYFLFTYKPTPTVSSILKNIHLSDKARSILYQADPVVDSKKQFSRDCGVDDTKMLELGCYNKGRIYIMKIDNPELSSEMSTVMVHEMLHAAWIRLNESKKNELTKQIMLFYEKSGDDDLRSRISSYQRTEPGQTANELHSILPSEYSKLSSDLEKYYSQYFSNRLQAVSEHEKFISVFNKLRYQLNVQLENIQSMKVDLKVVNDKLETLKEQRSVTQYNELVPMQNRMVDEVNTEIGKYSNSVDEYNALSGSLNFRQLPTATKGTK